MTRRGCVTVLNAASEDFHVDAGNWVVGSLVGKCISTENSGGIQCLFPSYSTTIR
jgi:hypothetical protein